MASTHNTSLVDAAGSPAQHDPMVAALLPEFLHDVFTDNIGENSKPHAEARTHANDKEIVMCVPVVATSELRRVLQDEQEHDGTTILRSSDLCPELTEEFPQHKQVQAKPPARIKFQSRYKIKQVRCNLSASYLEYRYRRFCSMKARAAAAATADSWPPGILKGIWAAVKIVYNCRLLLIQWALINIDPLGPLAPLIFSLVYVMVGYWFLYSDPYEGLLIKMGINTLSIIWAIDLLAELKSNVLASRSQSDRDNKLEYFR